jgi:short-subunit dehydrogenase
MKTFLSIGTGPGIGYETAARFAREGYRVVLSARNIDKLNTLASKLKAANFQVETRAVDASSPENIATLVHEVVASFGSIDVVHYNAANLRQATVDSQVVNTFNSDLAVNIGGALAAVNAVNPKMEKQGSGTILLTGGGFGIYPSPDYLSLSIGKAGIRALTLGLFESNKEKNIHVATVTVCAFVSPDTQQTADIAEQFWALHNQPKSEWTAEIMYPATE